LYTLRANNLNSACLADLVQNRRYPKQEIPIPLRAVNAKIRPELAFGHDQIPSELHSLATAKAKYSSLIQIQILARVSQA